MFLAITGCVIALWVFSQTYLQPAPDPQLELSEFIENSGTLPSTQVPAAYESEATTVAGPVNFDPGNRRPASDSTASRRSPAVSGGSFRREAPSGRQTESPSAGSSISRALQSTQNQAPAQDASPDTSPESSLPGAGQDESRPANVGGFQLPPAGQAQGMEQSKRTPDDSTSNRRYVPFRSSMASRPN